jgi:hypothetical protein
LAEGIDTGSAGGKIVFPIFAALASVAASDDCQPAALFRSDQTRPGAFLDQAPLETDSDQKADAPAGASAADTTASDGNAPVITATTSLITVVFGLTMAARRPNR